jgi:hypothetical protein
MADHEDALARADEEFEQLKDDADRRADQTAAVERELDGDEEEGSRPPRPEASS